MRRTILLATALAALVAAGSAVAHLRTTGISSVSADLSATTPANVDTRSCTNDAGDTIEFTKGTWTGTASSSEDDLKGEVKLRLLSVYNATKKLGTVEGRLKIGSGEDKTWAKVFGVVADGQLDGFVYGIAGHREARVLGSLTGGFTKTGGLTDAKLGSGSAADLAALAGRPGCERKEAKIAVRLFVRGEVTSITDGAITVKPRDGSAEQTCSLRGEGQIRGLEAGDDVRLHCAQVAGVWTLVKVSAKRHKD